MEHIIVRVDADGVTGWGECVADGHPYYSYETTETAWHILRDFLVPAVLGQELTRVDEAIALTARVRGHMMAKAGLEAALWDALREGAGRVALEDARRRARADRRRRERRNPADAGGAAATRWRATSDEGYRRIKIEIAPGRDLAYVKAVRRGVSRHSRSRWTPTRPTSSTT